MELEYAIGSNERERGDLPHLPVVNMFAESYGPEKKVLLQSRPGLESAAISMGAGPVSELFKITGVLTDQVFGVSGGALYGNSTLIGSIDGSGHTSFGGYETIVFTNSGESIWAYDGATLTSIAFPDSADVVKILVAASRLVAIREDTGQFYWSDPLASTIGALDFATAENSPDNLKDMLFFGDTLILFGTETIEFWPVTSDDALPFQPLIGRVFPVGIRETGCVVQMGSSFAWVTNENQICLGDPSKVVSTPGLQALLDQSATARLWTFQLDGDEYLALRMDDSTWVLSSRSEQWTEMASHGSDNWLPTCYEEGFFGASDGTLLQFSADHYDRGGVLERRFRAWLPITDKGVRVYSLNLRTNPGHTPILTGDYSDPVVELRTSSDGGNTWGPWKARTMGVMGRYRTKTRWNGLGMFGYPGMMVEIRITDPTPFRVSGITINEPFGSI